MDNTLGTRGIYKKPAQSKVTLELMINAHDPAWSEALKVAWDLRTWQLNHVGSQDHLISKTLQSVLKFTTWNLWPWPWHLSLVLQKVILNEETSLINVQLHITNLPTSKNHYTNWFLAQTYLSLRLNYSWEILSVQAISTELNHKTVCCLTSAIALTCEVCFLGL